MKPEGGLIVVHHSEGNGCTGELTSTPSGRRSGTVRCYARQVNLKPLVSFLLLTAFGVGPLVSCVELGGAPEGATAFSINLARQPDALVSLTLPESSRPDGRTSPDFVPFLEAFEEVRRDGERVEWKAPLPFRTLFYDENSRRKPPEMVLRNAENRMLPFKERTSKEIGRKGSWGYSGGHVFVVTDAESGPPEGYIVSFPKATSVENSLNRSTAGLANKAFALRTLPIYQAYRTGLFLPAPASATFEIEVPLKGRLSFSALLLKPAVSVKQRGDGAVLDVFADVDGGSKRLKRVKLDPGRGQAVEISLSKYAGQKISLRFETDPKNNALFDYVFLAEPTVYTPKRAPDRLVMVFVDTLRADHLGTYGYDRETSPVLDQWAENAAVFESAYAPAPWTLPSARSAVSGRWPDDWDAVPHIGERLAENGWATFSVVTNAYVSDAFGLAEGWSSHRGNLAIPAEKQWDRAKAMLETVEDRDAAVFLHLIDPHLPYKEPKAYRDLWEGPAPEPFSTEGVTAKNVEPAWQRQTDDAGREAVERHIVGRYDQNIRYVDDVFRDILQSVGPNATVVFFSDHGEEFWEDGEMGHGHSLSQELVRVPLIISSPGLEGSRVNAPASLIDIVPTVLELLDIETADSFDGLSLVGAAQGDSDALAALADRPLGLGWSIFGSDGWGAVSNQHKWVSIDGTEAVYDVAADPTEDTPLDEDVARFHRALSEALGRPVWKVWRVEGPGRAGKLTPQMMKVTVSHPQGFERVWARWDPLGERAEPVLEGNTVTIARDGQSAPPREVFLKPKSALDDLEGLSLGTSYMKRADTVVYGKDLTATTEGALLAIGTSDRRTKITYAVHPEPRSVRGGIQDAEVNAALKALGYVE